MSALLDHEPCSLNAQVFDRFSRRLARLCMKCAAELAWTKMRGLGKLFDRQWSMQIALGIYQRALDTVGFRFQFKQG